MPECTMVNLLFDIVVESFGSDQTIRCFGCLQFVNSFDTATEIVQLCPAVIGRVYHRTYISRLFTFFCSLGLLGGLPSISMFLYSAWA